VALVRAYRRALRPLFRIMSPLLGPHPRVRKGTPAAPPEIRGRLCTRVPGGRPARRWLEGQGEGATGQTRPPASPASSCCCSGTCSARGLRLRQTQPDPKEVPPARARRRSRAGHGRAPRLGRQQRAARGAARNRPLGRPRLPPPRQRPGSRARARARQRHAHLQSRQARPVGAPRRSRCGRPVGVLVQPPPWRTEQVLAERHVERGLSWGAASLRGGAGRRCVVGLERRDGALEPSRYSR
jgi:hypothetical protein